MKIRSPKNFNELLKLAGSYFWGTRMDAYKSELHGSLEVWLINGKLMLNSPNANQSYDSLHDVFTEVFQEIRLDQQPVRNVLLLGLGAGSVPAIIEEELMMNCKITAIEKDPLMILLGKKYFNVDRFKQLHIIQDDALLYVMNCPISFDLIIVDLFTDDHVPEPFTMETFLYRLCSLLPREGFLLFNMIVQNDTQTSQFDKLYQFFSSQNGYTKILYPIASNKVLYWQKNG